ncbi:hypothetical protein B0H13DRAFT_2681888 [Mycena leptocephala]|nr:hypothetical protein B0H13DRAFT_2681888 [Mycena leptocephala]
MVGWSTERWCRATCPPTIKARTTISGAYGYEDLPPFVAPRRDLETFSQRGLAYDALQTAYPPSAPTPTLGAHNSFDRSPFCSRSRPYAYALESWGLCSSSRPPHELSYFSLLERHLRLCRAGFKRDAAFLHALYILLAPSALITQPFYIQAMGDERVHQDKKEHADFLSMLGLDPSNRTILFKSSSGSVTQAVLTRQYLHIVFPFIRSSNADIYVPRLIDVLDVPSKWASIAFHSAVPSGLLFRTAAFSIIGCLSHIPFTSPQSFVTPLLDAS